MSYDAICDGARARHLSVLGAFHATDDKDLPEGTRSVVMLGPDEPGFWPAVLSSPEWQDKRPDPIDRWSARVIGEWAGDIGAQALFPFGGPPHKPFFSWATRTGRIHASPVLLLVHDRAGLFVSFRGALALPRRIDLPSNPANPCESCAGRPCLIACPVGALTPQGYDVPGCKSHIAGTDSAGCMSQGCAARRACPVSQNFGRLPAQSAHHMESFLKP